MGVTKGVVLVLFGVGFFFLPFLSFHRANCSRPQVEITSIFFLALDLLLLAHEVSVICFREQPLAWQMIIPMVICQCLGCSWAKILIFLRSSINHSSLGFCLQLLVISCCSPLIWVSFCLISVGIVVIQLCPNTELFSGRILVQSLV